MKYAENLTEK